MNPAGAGAGAGGGGEVSRGGSLGAPSSGTSQSLPGNPTLWRARHPGAFAKGKEEFLL